MRAVRVCLAVLFLAAATATSNAQSAADVAVYPLSLTSKEDSSLRSLADTYTTRLAEQLRLLGVSVVARPATEEKTLHKARVARFAVVGKVVRVSEKIKIETRLLDAATGVEQRAYFATGDASEVMRFADGVAARIAGTVRPRSDTTASIHLWAVREGQLTSSPARKSRTLASNRPYSPARRAKVPDRIAG